MAQPFADPCTDGLIQAEPCPRAQGREIAPPRRVWVLAACVLASSMAFIDGSALTVALPDLRADLGASFAAIQWVLNGYVLALAALTLIGGALADVYGKARILAVGCALFGLASIACALAPSVAWLIAARIVQGMAAAMLTPASLALIGAIYPRDGRSRAIGIWAAASAITTAGGPVLGGWLVDVSGWQAVFWINPPLAAATIAILAFAAPQDRREARRFDLPGAAILAAALGAIAWALSASGAVEGQSASAEWAVGIVPWLAGGLGLIGLAVYWHWERRSSHPMTPPRLAANRAFAGLNMATLLIYAGLAIMFFLLSFDLIDRRGTPAAEAGLAFLPFTLGVGLLSRPFGHVADRIGTRPFLILGPVGAAIAYAWMAAAQEVSLAWGVLAPMTLLGISFAILITPLTASVLSSVDDKDEGLASGVNNAASRVAQLAGIALAAGLAATAGGYVQGLVVAAVVSLLGGGINAIALRHK